jgi:transposase
VSMEFRPCVIIITSGEKRSFLIIGRVTRTTITAQILNWKNIIHRIHLTFRFNMYVIIVTIMSPSKKQETEDGKAQSLSEHHALHPHPENVRDEAFQRYEFLDSRDDVQVRYEMLRRHRLEGKPVSEVARAFGVSRQAFYVTEAVFSQHGIPGLLPRRRGPKRAHKCTEEVLDFVQQWRPEGKETLTEAIRRNFGVAINPRSIARAVARRKKKRTRKEETQE